MGGHEQIAHHATHRLAGGIDAVGIDAVLLLDRVEQVDGRLSTGGDAETVIDDNLVVLWSKDKAGVLSLVARRGPHRSAIALEQRVVVILVGSAGVMHEQYQGITLGGVVVFGDEEVVPERHAGLVVLESELFEIVGDERAALVARQLSARLVGLAGCRLDGLDLRQCSCDGEGIALARGAVAGGDASGGIASLPIVFRIVRLVVVFLHVRTEVGRE